MASSLTLAASSNRAKCVVIPQRYGIFGIGEVSILRSYTGDLGGAVFGGGELPGDFAFAKAQKFPFSLQPQGLLLGRYIGP